MVDREKVINAIETAKWITISGYDYLAIRPFIAKKIIELLNEEAPVIDSSRNRRCPQCNTILKGRFCHECGQGVKLDGT